MILEIQVSLVSSAVSQTVCHCECNHIRLNLSGDVLSWSKLFGFIQMSVLNTEKSTLRGWQALHVLFLVADNTHSGFITSRERMFWGISSNTKRWCLPIASKVTGVKSWLQFFFILTTFTEKQTVFPVPSSCLYPWSPQYRHNQWTRPWIEDNLPHFLRDGNKLPSNCIFEGDSLLQKVYTFFISFLFLSLEKHPDSIWPVRTSTFSCRWTGYV